MGPDGLPFPNLSVIFIKKELDNFLHKHQETSDAMLKKIIESEKDGKPIAVVTKLAREGAKKANMHNRKLRGLPSAPDRYEG